MLPDTVIVSVMSCAAPRFRSERVDIPQSKYDALMYQRISVMLKAAANLGYEYLVLGVFDCGAIHDDVLAVSDHSITIALF